MSHTSHTFRRSTCILSLDDRLLPQTSDPDGPGLPPLFHSCSASPPLISLALPPPNAIDSLHPPAQRTCARAYAALHFHCRRHLRSATAVVAVVVVDVSALQRGRLPDLSCIAPMTLASGVV